MIFQEVKESKFKMLQREKWQRRRKIILFYFTQKSCYCQSHIKTGSLFSCVYLFLFPQMPLNFLLEAKSLSLPRKISNAFSGIDMNHTKDNEEAPSTPAPLGPQLLLDLCSWKAFCRKGRTGFTDMKTVQSQEALCSEELCLWVNNLVAILKSLTCSSRMQQREHGLWNQEH